MTIMILSSGRRLSTAIILQLCNTESNTHSKVFYIFRLVTQGQNRFFHQLGPIHDLKSKIKTKTPSKTKKQIKNLAEQKAPPLFKNTTITVKSSIQTAQLSPTVSAQLRGRLRCRDKNKSQV